MSKTQLARGIWTDFPPTEDPFATPDGMVANLRLIDDHLALYTLAGPVPATTMLPSDARQGAGQIFTNGTYAVLNAGIWQTYPSRMGMRAIELVNKTEYINIGTGWQVVTQKNEKSYLTRAIMLADTAQPAGSQGVVTNDPGHTTANPINGVYTWTGAAWVRNAFQPANQFDVDSLAERTGTQEGLMEEVQEVLPPLAQTLQVRTMAHDDEGGKYPLALTDLERILAGFREDGGLLLRNLLLHPDGGMHLDLAGRTLLRELADGYQLGPLRIQLSETGIHIMDRWGRCALTITRKGKVIIPDLLTDAAAPVEQSLSIPQACRFVTAFRRRDINHILVFGQSLSRGSTSVNPISTVQPYNNKTLKGGVLARPTDAEYDATDFKDLVEQALASSGSNAESPTSGICNGVVRRLVLDGELPANWVFCGTSSGNGATSVTGLTNTWLPGLKRVVADTKALCDAKSLSYGVAAHVYIQGEQDIRPESTDGLRTAFDYDQGIGDLHEDLVRHIMKTTGQEWAPYLVTYQVGTHRRYNVDKMWVALQQWRSSRLNEWHVLAVPVYAMPTGTDNLHLTAEGYWLMGEYIARAIHWSQYRKQGKWRPLEPIQVDWTETHIDVTFHVPCKPIVIDTALCAAYENAGFVMRDGADAVINIISSATVISDDTVRLTLSEPAPADATLTHARGKPTDPILGGPVGGPRSNVRDSHGLYDLATSPLGNTFALHNPAVMFEFNRRKGF